MPNKLRAAAALMLILMMILTVSCNKAVNANADAQSPDSQNSKSEDSPNSKDSEESPQISDEEKARIEMENKKAEREEQEKTRKEQQKEFYVPLIPVEQEHEKKTTEVKALHVTGHTAGNDLDKSRIDAFGAYVKALSDNDKVKAAELSVKAQEANKLEQIVGIAIGTEINAVVIDFKEDEGFATYQSNIEIVKEMNEGVPLMIKDINGMMKVLKEYDIYTIARIVAFKDKNLAVAKPEHAIQLKTGGVWLDPNSGKIPWVNPFDKYVWDYNVAIAKEAALIGFDEIQFDYVRFPDGAKSYNPITEFPGREGRDKDEAIADFLSYAKKELKPYNVNLGADVFGITTRTWDDYPEDIGQTWILMGQHVDNICPMVYPSHYGAGWYGLDNPNAYPYEVLKGSMMEAAEKNSSMETPPIVRPWIQNFNWAGITYGPEKVRAQLKASKEVGYNEYMIWNPSNNYDPHCFILDDEEKSATYPADTGDLDLAGRTPADAADKFLTGEQNKRYSYMYLTTPKKDRDSDFDAFQKAQENKQENLISYKVHSYETDPIDKDKAAVILDCKYEIKSGETLKISEKTNTKWNAVREDGIWKIKKTIDM